MQIVISIPDKYVSPDKSILDIINEMVGNGLKIDCTILPKNHGRLIDADALKDNAYEIDSMYCVYDTVVDVTDIDNAPTIIEAEE